MSEDRPKVSDHWMILRCGVGIWNRWRDTNPEARPSLKDVNLANANLADANLGGANFADACLRAADLEDAMLKDVDLTGAELRKVNLRHAVLEGADLKDTDLRDADLQCANLGGAKLRDSDLRNSDFRGANLEGAGLWSASLGNTSLQKAIFRDADLRGADLRKADFDSANLERADFRNANLWNADLRHVNLQGADLRLADLEGTNLCGAQLSGANLADARLSSTYFHDLDLREVKGLEEISHLGPSPLSSQTLEMSQSQIPETFLKGCGLKDWEVLAAKLHNPNLRPDEITDLAYQIDRARGSSPIVPLSLFISYSHENQRFVEKLEAQFDKDGIRYWRDIHDLKAGPIEAQVDRAIGLQRATLLVLSEDSVESDWAVSEARRAREVEKARRKGGEGKYVLCPIALDDAWKTCDWPRRLREQIMEYNILDFSRWGSDEEFEKEYGKLKGGLGIYYAKDASGGS